MTSTGRAAWTPHTYGALAREGFGKNPVSYRCIRMIAEAAASVPLTAFADGARAPDHPLQRLIDRPNPEQSAPDLMEAFFAALQTSGDAYLQAVDDPPTELYAPAARSGERHPGIARLALVLPLPGGRGHDADRAGTRRGSCRCFT